MRRFFHIITSNRISVVGSAVTTASAITFLGLFLLDFVGLQTTVYVGILTYLILPAMFVLGLLIIPVGIVRARRLKRKAEPSDKKRSWLPVIDLNEPRAQGLTVLFGLLTFGNVVILGAATYKGVEVMDSTEFCGAACHSVMQPEYVAYQRSPHARVKCVSCHIGPGADWFAKSKLSGAWQVVATTLDLYPRPIPAPIVALRPARETCEQCHWPTKFVGDRFKVVTHYADDEANTELKTVLLLRVGGIKGRESHGIHWHVDPANRIRYRSDAKRLTIYDVEMHVGEDETMIFKPGGEDAPADATEWREMDCVDCHNRPTHIYHTPESGVDEALALGKISAALPFVRREGVRLVKEVYTSHEEARQKIAEGLEAFYASEHAEVASAQAAEIDAAAEALGDIYAGNVFPDMKVTWDTYPNHIGHADDLGCFRCHDDEHENDRGEVISQDCDTCHSLLAEEEQDPEILTQLQP